MGDIDFFKENLLKFQSDITRHIENETNSVCCQGLRILFSTIDCIEEDINEWNSKDTELWLSLMQSDGICDTAMCEIYKKLQQTIYQIKPAVVAVPAQQEENIQNSNLFLTSNSIVSKKAVENDEDHEFSEVTNIENIRNLENQIGNLTKQIEALTKETSQLEGKYEEKQIEIEAEKFEEVVIEKSQFLYSVKKELDDHYLVCKQCDSHMLYANIETIIMDLTTWNEDDTIGWLEIFQLIQTLNCLEGANILIKVNQFLIETQNWIDLFPRMIQKKISPTQETNILDAYTVNLSNMMKNLQVEQDFIKAQLKKGEEIY